tara:strand:+ start:99172 stop:100245 length:1074 start_codon:yes stop_codon:yes gene_type:complete
MYKRSFEDRGDYLRVELPSGALADFHYFWLRHNCACCVHPTTKERILCPSKVPLDIRPTSIANDDGAIAIVWQGGHESVFPREWLSRHQYSGEAHASKIEAEDLSLIEVPYGECRASLVTTCQRYIAERGAIVVRNCPLDAEQIITMFDDSDLVIRGTHFGRIEDLKTNNSTNENNDQLGYTDAAVDLHTDQPFIEDPPWLQMLVCIERGTTGGHNQLADMRQAALYLRDTNRHAFDVLVNTPVTFDRQQKNFSSTTSYPILSFKDGEFEQVRSSYFTLAPLSIAFDAMKQWYQAYKELVRLIESPENRFRFVLSPGDFILYDNHRMLHAREGFSGPRWLKGIYFDRRPEGNASDGK